MPSKVAPVLRASCAAGLLALCVAAAAAERKSPLIGATKDEVLARFGEPKSHMVAGPREVLFFAKERVVLRDNRVVEVEEIQADVPTPAPKPAAKPAVATPAPESAAAEPAPADTAPSPTTHRAAPDAPEKTNEPASAVALPPPEPEVQIKSVRPPSRTTTSQAATPAPIPSASTAASAGSAATPPGPAAAAPAKPTAEPPAEVVTSTQPPAKSISPDTARTVAGTPAVTPSPVAPPPAPEAAPGSTSVTEPPASPAASVKSESQAPAEPAPTPTPSATADAPDHSTPTAAQPVPAAKRGRSAAAHPEVVVPDAAESVFTTTNKLIALAVILIGGGYLVWRRRQRTMLLEVTAVSRSPFVAETPVATSTGSKFTPELLQKLEWCRFEELVAAYYNKTGVVASRTKSGPDSAVHIRISWKGEQRPFASVQCIANPPELVGPAQVQALCEVLAAEDIRRGYIVTSGKFSVPARDLAEEKHVTLLPGDIFLEKLNALPEPVRSELIRDATSGDYTTPTCPKCEIKTVRGEGSGWKCVQCGTQLER